MKRKLMSLFLAMVMVLAMIPTTAMAATTIPEPKLTQTKVDGLIQDSLEYTFQSDPAAIGEWVTYDYIESIPEKYDPNRKGRVSSISNEGWVGSGFYPDGTLVMRYRSGDLYEKWTSGYMMWSSLTVAPAYTIQEIDGRSFMFVEWKSGDYSREGEIYGYYVLEKVKGNATDPNAAENFMIRDGMLIRYLGTGKNLHVIVPEGITSLEVYALSFNDGIVEVTLPNSLEEVYYPAFYNMNFLSTINVGTGAKNFYQYENFGSYFQACPSLENVNVADGNKFMYDIDGVPFLTENKELIFYPSGRTVKSYSILDGTKSVRANSFAENPWIVELTVPGTVKETSFRSLTADRIIIGEGATVGSKDMRGSESISTVELVLPSNDIGLTETEADWIIYGKPGTYAETWAKTSGQTFRPGQPSDYTGALNTDKADAWAVPTINAAADKGILHIRDQYSYKEKLTHYDLVNLLRTFVETNSDKALVDVLHAANKDMLPFNITPDMPVPVSNVVAGVVMQLGLLCNDIPVRIQNPVVSSSSVYLDIYGTNVTREQLAETVYKLAVMFKLGDMTKTPAKAPSDMANVTQSRVAAVNFCVANGLINAGGNGAFNPKGEVTRQEAIVVLYRLSELTPRK